ncbi:hypothetical protein CoNPh26_CDS0174 [Staphylococcus phage S-CoN_Ph26]|nr:hypothetical protein CoNPh26_CDS0174 [Staphylococcus phage S-CoN_Ph26]
MAGSIIRYNTSKKKIRRRRLCHLSVHDGYVNKKPLNIVSKPDNLRIVSMR